jgi:hypothetical protein
MDEVQPEDLIEIVVSDDPPMDEESSNAISDPSDDQGIEDETDIIDMSICCFEQHNDSVYCVATNLTMPGVIVTGFI